MISLDRLSHSMTVKGGRRWLLRDQTVVFGSTDRVGIYLEKGAGKTVLSRLLCGIDQPDFGQIRHSGSVSWPIGLAGIIHQDLRLSENLEIILRLSTSDAGSAIERARHLIDADLDLNARAKDLTPSERALFGYALSVMVPRQHYIFDEKVTVGTTTQRARQEELLRASLNTSGLVLMSSNQRLIDQYCDQKYQISRASLVGIGNQDTPLKVVAHV